jgi:hypothetical protein
MFSKLLVQGTTYANCFCSSFIYSYPIACGHYIVQVEKIVERIVEVEKIVENIIYKDVMVPKEVNKYVEVAVPYEKIVEIHVPVEKVMMFEDMFLLGIFIHHAILFKKVAYKKCRFCMQPCYLPLNQGLEQNSLMRAHTDRRSTENGRVIYAYCTATVEGAIN